MVNIQSHQLDLIFYALSDPTRRQILRRAKEGVVTVGELALPFKMTLAAVSKHVKVLERAKLIKKEKVGRIHQCSFNPEALRSAEECLKFYVSFWTESLDMFANEIEASSQTSRRRKSRAQTKN